MFQSRSYVDFVQSTAAHTTRFFKKACCVPSRFWVLWPTVLYITVARFLFCGAELLICLGFWGFLTRHPKMKERMTCMTRMSFLGQDAPFIFFKRHELMLLWLDWMLLLLYWSWEILNMLRKMWRMRKCIEHHRSRKELLQRCEGKVIETDVFFFLSHLAFPFFSFRFRVCFVFYVMFYVLRVVVFHRRS